MDLMPAGLTWLRPGWLLAWPLMLLLALALAWRRSRGASGAWRQAVDAHLLPHLLERMAIRGQGLPTALALLAGTLAVLTLAGPSWREREQPLWQSEAPLVIALDLSSAMRAVDLAPSRLTQARAKLARLLAQREGGQVGLLAFAGDAYPVAPITRDARTVAILLDSLTPDVMPQDGQRVDRAIAQAQSMLHASGASGGEILLLTDHSDAAGVAAAANARSAGVRVSVLGVGTLAGAPLSGPHGFLTGADGQPQLARLDPVGLAELARAGGGSYAALTVDDGDLRALRVLEANHDSVTAIVAGEGGSARVRSDDGYWLLLVLLPLALLGFRRGWLALLTLTLAMGLTIRSGPSLADAVGSNTGANADRSWWSALWQRADQRSHAALQAGDAARARALAPDEALRAAAAYREKDYAAAASTWAALDSADAHYNRGNALAQAGRLQEALTAYDRALAREPGMADAVANRKLVEELLKQQEQQEQQEQREGERPQDEQQGEQQQGEQQQGEQQQGEQQGQQQGRQRADEDQQDAQSPASAAQQAAQQEAADEAQKRQMQQALQQAQQDGDPQRVAPPTPEQRAQAEQQQANQQLLRRVPDDPGALLRRKFLLEHQRRQREGGR